MRLGEQDTLVVKLTGIKDCSNDTGQRGVYLAGTGTVGTGIPSKLNVS
jgi:hypothetical protein